MESGQENCDRVQGARLIALYTSTDKKRINILLDILSDSSMMRRFDYVARTYLVNSGSIPSIQNSMVEDLLESLRVIYARHDSVLDTPPHTSTMRQFDHGHRADDNMNKIPDLLIMDYICCVYVAHSVHGDAYSMRKNMEKFSIIHPTIAFSADARFTDAGRSFFFRQIYMFQEHTTRVPPAIRHAAADSLVQEMEGFDKESHEEKKRNAKAVMDELKKRLMDKKKAIEEAQMVLVRTLSQGERKIEQPTDVDGTNATPCGSQFTSHDR